MAGAMPFKLQTSGTSTCHKKIKRTATLSCRTRKRAFNFYSSGVVRRSHVAVRNVRALLYGPPLLLLPPLLVVLLCIDNLMIKN